MSNTQLTNKCDGILFWMLIILLAWVPIPLASNRGWSLSLMEVLIFSIAVGVMLKSLMVPPHRVNALGPFKWPIGLLIVWLCYHLFQIVPLPYSTLEFIRPASIELHKYLLGEGYGAARSISIDYNQTLQTLLKNAAYITLLLLVITLVNTRQRIRQMALMIVYAGAANAIYGLANYYVDSYMQPFLVWDFAVSGTYVNRNHFAGLMEMCIPIAIGLILANQENERFYPTFKARIRGYLSFLLSVKSMLHLCVFVMFVALLLSASRGGIVSLVSALIVCVILTRFMNGISVSYWRIGRTIALMAILSVSWFGLGSLESKLEKWGVESNRSKIREATYSLIMDYPVLGTGAGTYEWIFSLYKTPELKGDIYDHAHNDYLELIANQGIIGSILLGMPLILMFKRIVIALLNRRDPVLGGILFGVVCGVLSMLIHAAVDFNFRIPANASIFWSLIGLGISCAIVRCNKRHRSG